MSYAERAKPEAIIAKATLLAEAAVNQQKSHIKFIRELE